MFDIGWMELMVIGVVALIVVGPKDLPGLFRTMGQFMGKARGMAREFQRSMEDAAKESGLNEASSALNSIRDPFSAATKSARNFADDALKGKPAGTAGKTGGAATGDAAKPAPAPAPSVSAGDGPVPDPAAPAPASSPAPASGPNPASGPAPAPQPAATAASSSADAGSDAGAAGKAAGV